MARDGCVDTEAALLDFCLQLRRESTFNAGELLSALAFCAGNTIERDFGIAGALVEEIFMKRLNESRATTRARLQGHLTPLGGG